MNCSHCWLGVCGCEPFFLLTVALLCVWMSCEHFCALMMFILWKQFCDGHLVIYSHPTATQWSSGNRLDSVQIWTVNCSCVRSVIALMVGVLWTLGVEMFMIAEHFVLICSLLQNAWCWNDHYCRTLCVEIFIIAKHLVLECSLLQNIWCWYMFIIAEHFVLKCSLLWNTWCWYVHYCRTLRAEMFIIVERLVLICSLLQNTLCWNGHYCRAVCVKIL